MKSVFISIIAIGFITMISMSQRVYARETITVKKGETRTETLNAPNDDTDVFNNGQITTGGQREAGISNLGNKNEITNNDTIITNGALANGILSSGNDVIITNNGVIRTVNSGSGIAGKGDNVTIINKNIIELKGNSHGMSNNGNRSTVINELGATITIKNGGAGIIVSDGEDINIINRGTINTSGLGLYLLHSSGITYDDSRQIERLKHYGTIANYGTINIATQDANDDGVIDDKDEVSDRETAIGIVLQKNNSKAYNYGDINMNITAKNVVGIASVESGSVKLGKKINNNSEIFNAKNINVSGGTEINAGIYIGNSGINNKVTNTDTGKIIVSGYNAIGIHIDNSINAIINNAGIIKATGVNAFAIKGEDGAETVNLFYSSDTTGDIELGKGSDEMNFYLGAIHTGKIDFDEAGNGNDTDHDIFNVHGSPGQQQSYVMSLENITGYEELNLINITGVLIGKNIITVDPTEQAVKATVLNTLTTGIHGIINKRLNSLTDLSKNSWVDYYHTYRQRADERGMAEYDQNINGGIGGYDREFGLGRVGVMGGYTKSDTESNSNSFETETDSFFGGIYAIRNSRFIDIQGSLLFGREDHDNDRTVNVGAETEIAHSTFYSTFLSPSLTVSKSFGLSEKLTLSPTAGIVYSYAWYDDYTETGTTVANLSIDDRHLDAVKWNAGFDIAYQATEECQLKIFGNGSGRWTDDEGITAVIDGHSFEIESKSDDSVRSANFGASFNMNILDRLSANASYQHSETSGDESSDVISAGFNFNF